MPMCVLLLSTDIFYCMLAFFQLVLFTFSVMLLRHEVLSNRKTGSISVFMFLAIVTSYTDNDEIETLLMF